MRFPTAKLCTQCVHKLVFVCNYHERTICEYALCGACCLDYHYCTRPGTTSVLYRQVNRLRLNYIH
jgi:hypothetical protein